MNSSPLEPTRSRPLRSASTASGRKTNGRTDRPGRTSNRNSKSGRNTCTKGSGGMIPPTVRRLLLLLLLLLPKKNNSSTKKNSNHEDTKHNEGTKSQTHPEEEAPSQGTTTGATAATAAAAAFAVPSTYIPATDHDDKIHKMHVKVRVQHDGGFQNDFLFAERMPISSATVWHGLETQHSSSEADGTRTTC